MVFFIEDNGEIYVAGYLEYTMKRNGKEPTIVPKSVWELVPKEDQADYDVKDRGDSVEVRYVSKKRTTRLNEQEEQDGRRDDDNQVPGPGRHSKTERETGPHQSDSVERNGQGRSKRSPEGDEQPSVRRVPQPEVQGNVPPPEAGNVQSGGLLKEEPDLKNGYTGNSLKSLQKKPKRLLR